jgi:hypothetical protein
LSFTKNINLGKKLLWCPGRKVKKIFGKIKDACIFALPTTKKASLKKHKRLKGRTKGRLAQLVQSTCLTSRGSLVRTQYLPPKKKPFRDSERLFCYYGQFKLLGRLLLGVI